MIVVPEAGTVISISFAQTAPTIWTGTATCVHGTTRNATLLIRPGVPPLDHTAMVDSLYRQHDLLIGCTCTRQTPLVNATISTQPANAVLPGQQRYIPQAGATLTGSHFWFGAPVTCNRVGAYQVQGSVALSRSVAQGASGLGVLVISGVPVLNVPMVDQAGVATASISAALNIGPNQSVNLGYENTSAQVQDVQTTTLVISEVWVP
jgi:hypothetical protein